MTSDNAKRIKPITRLQERNTQGKLLKKIEDKENAS
jgi:hypothetical protein